MRFFVLLAALLVAPHFSHAQYTGLSAFAAMSSRFPCDRYLQIVNRSPAPAMSVLWGTFGEDLSCIVRFIEQNSHRPHLVQIHFSNETCRRNRKCYEGEIYGQMSVDAYNRALENFDFFVYLAIQQRVLEIRRFADDHGKPTTTWMLSTGLEDNYTQRAYQNLTDYLHASGHWPHIIVRNPLKNRGFQYGDFYERHGSDARCRSGSTNVVNEDGSDPSYRDSERFLRNNRTDCFARFLWRKHHQGRSSLSTRNITRPRGRKVTITDRDIYLLSQLMELQ